MRNAELREIPALTEPFPLRGEDKKVYNSVIPARIEVRGELQPESSHFNPCLSVFICGYIFFDSRFETVAALA